MIRTWRVFMDGFDRPTRIRCTEEHLDEALAGPGPFHRFDVEYGSSVRLNLARISAVEPVE